MNEQLTSQQHQAGQLTSTQHMAKLLTQRQHRAVESLITCTSIQDAAKSANVGQRTLYRWLQQEEFQAQVRRARQLSLTQLATHMQHSASHAAKTLNQVMQDEKATPAARVSAARCSMDLYYKPATLEDVMDRLITVEAQAKQSRR